VSDGAAFGIAVGVLMGGVLVSERTHTGTHRRQRSCVLRPVLCCLVLCCVVCVLCCVGGWCGDGSAQEDRQHATTLTSTGDTEWGKGGETGGTWERRCNKPEGGGQKVGLS
jgi:hypothetical protein